MATMALIPNRGGAVGGATVNDLINIIIRNRKVDESCV